MTDAMPFTWGPFLRDWSGEWSDSLSDDGTYAREDETARRDRWLGFPAAPEERIAALEERLGRRMPPSYREFLAVSDGWRHAGGFITLLAGTAEARWHNDASGLAAMFEEYLDEDPTPEELRDVAVWRRGLQLDVESDAMSVVLDPGDVDENGEWAVYTWAGWRAAPPQRFPDFATFMRDMHREFHCLRARPADGEPEFVNATTRRLDAQVEEARLWALGGDRERAERALDEAKGYGRPRAAGLGDQIRRLLGRTNLAYEDLAIDPRYAPELLPPLVAEHAANPHRDDSTLNYSLRGATDDVVTLAHTLLEQVRSGTYRYTAAGPFGEAVERARESARWGDTDGAWRTMLDALPLWQPLGPDHLAPLGWVADPLLGPLLTPERGRALLSTPRGGQPGEPRTAGADRSDPEGLSWLADPDAPGDHTSYRFVLVEGVEPWDLPGRLADGEEAALDEPVTVHEAHERSLRGRREFSSFDDRALVVVGRAGARWSFAFDGDRPHFAPQRFVSPAAAACADARAVVVWGGLRDGHGNPFFHLSVAKGGAELYAFTFADGEVRRTGPIPPALDPGRFFPSQEGPTGTGPAIRTERALLEAIAGEFGVHLPRHAITWGRLHTFTTRSWIRPPQDGETFSVIRFEWGSN
ncbi:SMI1/KNR4 family protein [Streptomyces durocortorensis]|uniref:SMI1/KNR4 family protein n=1 Tax=Streptomyces durocortorensis TaxID=2811104 RepID=A0ABS2HZU7_9ACTN|nr:SMI1/KNR4 family protein [Streptomyces durocortorensis]MBM7055328.1 SMI1/KNR4 family protein [Streptomyces durocortorensis]